MASFTFRELMSDDNMEHCQAGTLTQALVSRVFMETLKHKVGLLTQWLISRSSLSENQANMMWPKACNLNPTPIYLTCLRPKWKKRNESEITQSCPTLCDPMGSSLHQAPPSMGFSRQEYWSGLPLPSPGNLPDPGIEPRSPALYTDALPSEPPGKSYFYVPEASRQIKTLLSGMSF